MPVYRYKGYDEKTGAARKGTIEAESPKAARAKLKTRDKILASELSEEVAIDRLKRSKPLFGGGVKTTDVAVMTRQFATLQTAHLPLDETLKALTNQVENEVLRNALNNVKEQISEGSRSRIGSTLDTSPESIISPMPTGRGPGRRGPSGSHNFWPAGPS